MDAAQVAAGYSAEQSALARQIAAETALLWHGIDPANLDASWSAALPRAHALVSGGMVLAASTADTYLDDVLDAQNIDPAAEGRVDPRAFGQSASDGRALESLLQEPLIGTKAAIGAGAGPLEALAGGLLQLDMIVRTQLADAGRTAVGAGLTARRDAGGYIRLVSAGACSRCIVLAGRFYRWNEGFLRHPRCHCTNVPAAENRQSDLRTNPDLYFRSLSEAEQDRAFTKAGAQAIRDGADIGQVVNSRRGMYTAGGRKFTTESTTKRGVVPKKQRLTPEQIYADAGGDRDAAIAMLRENGYIAGGAKPVARTPAKATPAPAPAVKVPKQRVNLGKFHGPQDGVDDLAAAVRSVGRDAQRTKLTGGQSAATEFVVLPDGRRLVTKRASDWGDTSAEAQADVHHQAEAEQMASLLGRAIGAPVVRVYRSDVDRVWMDWGEGKPIGYLEDAEIEALVAGRDGQLLGLVDHLIANTDRNSGNILVHDGRMLGIDHGFSWTPDSLKRSGPSVQDGPDRPGSHFARDDQWVDNPLTQRDVRVLRDRLTALRPAFDRVGRGEWLDYSLARLEILGRHATGTVDLIA